MDSEDAAICLGIVTNVRDDLRAAKERLEHSSAIQRSAVHARLLDIVVDALQREVEKPQKSHNREASEGTTNR